MFIKNNMKKFIIVGAMFAPVVALAQLEVKTNNLTGLVAFIQSLLNVATTLIIALAVVWFLYGVFQFVMSKGDQEARDAGRDKIVSGIIGIAVMVSVWGLVKFVTSTFGLADEGNAAISAPGLPTIINVQ